MFKILLVILSFVDMLLVQGRVTDLLERDNASNSTRRVLFGADANPADFKFLVQLNVGSTLCGGSVISNYFILTAAHCIAYHQCESIKIFPSNWLRGTTSRVQPVQCYTDRKHTGKFLYDIAVIRTLDDLLADDDFEVISLPLPGASYAPGTPATIVGWGKTESRVYPDRLLFGNVIVEDWNICDYKFKHSEPECVSDENCPVPGIPRRAFCTQSPESNPLSTCDGDSGGSVIIDGRLAGVVTGAIFSEGECEFGAPSLHTNVADYLPWIYSIIDPHRDTSRMPVADEYW